MPEDYRQAFWEGPQDRLYDQDHPAPARTRPGRGLGGGNHLAQVQEDLWDGDPGPSLPPPGKRRAAPRRGLPRRDRLDRGPRGTLRTTGTGRRKRMPWQPIVSPRVQAKRAPPKRGRPAPGRGRKGETAWTGGQPPRKRRRRKVLLIVLIVLLALVAAGVIIHQIYVRPPEIPSQETSQGTDPGVLGAGRRDGVYTFLLVGRDDGGGGNTDTIMVGCYDVKNATPGRAEHLPGHPGGPTLGDQENQFRLQQQGMEGVQQQVKNLIGYVPDYYFVVELDAVAELVDAIGGVDYNVPYNMDYDDPSQDLSIHFQAGMQHLSGEDAVKVLRWRKNNSGENLSVGDGPGFGPAFLPPGFGPGDAQPGHHHQDRGHCGHHEPQPGEQPELRR